MAAKRKKVAAPTQLAMRIEAVDRVGGTIVPVEAPAPPREERLYEDASLAADEAFLREPREAFGRWLLIQRDRGDWIDDLVNAARRDPGFPKSGSVDDVRRRLDKLGADADAHEQLEDAERCWRSL